MAYTVVMALFAQLAFFFPFIIGFGVLLPGAVIAAKIQAYLRRKHIEHTLKNSQTIISEYQPPDNLKPAELGFLYDGIFGKHEIVGTLIDLVNRQVLIREVNKDRVVYKLSPSAAKAELSPYEKQFTEFIAQSQTGMTVNDIFNNSISATRTAGQVVLHIAGLQKSVENLISAGLKERGYYSKKSLIGGMFKLTLLISLIIAIIGAILLYVGLGVPSSMSGITMTENGRQVEQFSQGSRIMFAIMMGGIFNFVFSFIQVAWITGVYYKKVGYGPLATNKLKQLWPDIEGYKIFLKKVELDRINFQLSESPNKISNPHTAYAAALGLPIKMID